MIRNQTQPKPDTLGGGGHPWPWGDELSVLCKEISALSPLALGGAAAAVAGGRSCVWRRVVLLLFGAAVQSAGALVRDRPPDWDIPALWDRFRVPVCCALGHSSSLGRSPGWVSSGLGHASPLGQVQGPGCCTLGHSCRFGTFLRGAAAGMSPSDREVPKRRDLGTPTAAGGSAQVEASLRRRGRARVRPFRHREPGAGRPSA